MPLGPIVGLITVLNVGRPPSCQSVVMMSNRTVYQERVKGAAVPIEYDFILAQSILDNYILMDVSYR